jgi:hypothetical protein
VSKGRGRRQRERRPRPPAVPDPLPSPEVFDLELRAVVVQALKLKSAYRQTYIDGLAPMGGSGLSISNGVSNSTEASLTSPHQVASRVRARLATERLREAAGWIDRANKVLEGFTLLQPAKIDPKAVFSQREFDDQLHQQRERELRGEG